MSGGDGRKEPGGALGPSIQETRGSLPPEEVEEGRKGTVGSVWNMLSSRHQLSTAKHSRRSRTNTKTLTSSSSDDSVDEGQVYATGNWDRGSMKILESGCLSPQDWPGGPAFNQRPWLTWAELGCLCHGVSPFSSLNLLGLLKGSKIKWGVCKSEKETFSRASWKTLGESC